MDLYKPTVPSDSANAVALDSASKEDEKDVEKAYTLRMNMAMTQIQEEDEFDSDEAESKREDEEQSYSSSTAGDSNDAQKGMMDISGPFAEESLEDFTKRTGLQNAEQIMERLLALDQLNLHRAEGKVFIDYIEPLINFKPSYKFDPYTETYDTGKKNRGAAWCDRVLYSRKNSSQLKVVDYHCVHGIYHSDHRAVTAEFPTRS